MLNPLEAFLDGISPVIWPIEAIFRLEPGKSICIDRTLPANRNVSGKEIELCLGKKGRVPVWCKIALKKTITFRVPRKRKDWALYILRKEMGLEV